MTYAEMIGKTFGRWTVQGRDGSSHRLLCVCSCGVEKSVATSTIRLGKSSSCGCLRKEVQRDLHTKHGHADLRNGAVSSAYRRWQNMKTRCYNPKSKDYHNYGGRGIVVCARWRSSFEAFYADVGDPPRAGLTMDRQRVNGNYEPGNIRWATAKTQANNRQSNILTKV